MLRLLQFAYKCSEGGGWHDFFAYQDHLVPWSPAKERAGGEACNRLNFRGVDDVLHVNLHAGWEAYNSAGVSQVPHPLCNPLPPGCDGLTLWGSIRSTATNLGPFMCLHCG